MYTVASAKGGVGKTTTAAAIATLLADAGASVVAIDADLGMANLAGALGIDVEGETVHDVLAGRADPEAAVQEGPRGLRVLPGETDLDAYADADPAGLADVVAAFADADYVILDAGAGLSHDSALPLGIADRTLLVSTPEREALRDTAKTGELADRLGGTVDGAVITRVDPDDPHGHDDLIVSHLDVPIHERIPEDEAVGAAVAAGEPLVVFAPSAPATRGYRSLTERLTDVDLPEPESAVADDDAAGRGTDAVDVDDEPDAGPEPTATAGSTADVEMTVGDLTESSEDETDETDAVKADEADADEENEVDADEADEAEAEAEEATVDQPADPVIRNAEDEDANERAADGTSIEHDEIDGIVEATDSEGSAEPPEAVLPDADGQIGADERTEADRGERSEANEDERTEANEDERTEANEDDEESIDGGEAADDSNDPGVESVPFREDAGAESTSTGATRRPDRDDENDAKPGDERDDVGDESEADGESGDDESGDDGSESDGGGFFSRLLGR